MNELIFLLQTTIVSGGILLGLRLGPEALISVITGYGVLANLCVLKTITLFGLTATAADSFAIGATIGLNLLQEYFGKEITRKAILINTLALILYLILTQLHLWYIASPSDGTQEAYWLLFSSAPRIIIASLLVCFCAQQIDYRLYGILISHTPASWLLIRNYGSIVISQLFDTIAFSYLGLYGLVDHINQVILISYAVKLIALAACSPFLLIPRRIMPHRPSSK